VTNRPNISCTSARLDVIACLALLVYAWNFMNAGQARGKHRIAAPATTGHPEFERKLRVQQNMIEQLIVFLPSLWIFCLTVQPLVGAALGLIFVFGPHPLFGCLWPATHPSTAWASASAHCRR
jgi:glutathione S-transferase